MLCSYRLRLRTTGQKANYRLARSINGRVYPTRFRVYERSLLYTASSV